MIMLTKSDEPEILRQRKEEWTRELLAAVAAGDARRVNSLTRRYNHPDVKNALKEETRGKCAYCEAYVTDVAHGDIEHITPKSIKRDLTFDWANLTFACQICNQNKSSKEDIIDPYVDNPSEHLFFAGAFVKGKTPNGSRSVMELCLNRPSLIESRNREIERYADQIEKVFLVEDDSAKELFIQGMFDELSSGRPEFIAACQVVLERYCEARN